MPIKETLSEMTTEASADADPSSTCSIVVIRSGIRSVVSPVSWSANAPRVSNESGSVSVVKLVAPLNAKDEMLVTVLGRVKLKRPELQTQSGKYQQTCSRCQRSATGTQTFRHKRSASTRCADIRKEIKKAWPKEGKFVDVHSRHRPHLGKHSYFSKARDPMVVTVGGLTNTMCRSVAHP